MKECFLILNKLFFKKTKNIASFIKNILDLSENKLPVRIIKSYIMVYYYILLVKIIYFIIF